MPCCRASPAKARSSNQEEAAAGRHRIRPVEPGTHRPRPHADDGDHQRALRAQHPHRPVQPDPQEPEVPSAASRCRSSAPSCARSWCRPTSTSSSAVNRCAARPDRLRPDLVFAVIDALFGGAGKFHTHRGPRFLAHRAARHPRAWWRSSPPSTRRPGRHLPARAEYQRSEMQPQFANIATPSEIVVPPFTLEIGDTSGSIHFCIPYSTLELIRDTLYSTMQGDDHHPTAAGSTC